MIRLIAIALLAVTACAAPMLPPGGNIAPPPGAAAAIDAAADWVQVQSGLAYARELPPVYWFPGTCLEVPDELQSPCTAGLWVGPGVWAEGTVIHVADQVTAEAPLSWSTVGTILCHELAHELLWQTADYNGHDHDLFRAEHACGEHVSAAVEGGVP